MRSPAGNTPAAIGRGSDLLEQVDYRLALTPEEKEEIYNLRYRAYLREGAVKESPAQRVTDQYDDLPNSWTFGVYVGGELYSSVRISLLTSEWRQSCSAEAFGEILFPMLDQGKVIVDPARLPPETVVHPGHGSETTLGVELARNPFLAELRAEA